MRRTAMIKGIHIENIRIFEGPDWRFPLFPLTVFCGTNSSGKSTLLKVLLLLRQSMGIWEGYETERGRLRFVGSQVDFGDYSSAVSHNDIQRDISITLITEGHMPVVVANQLRSLKNMPTEDVAVESLGEPVPYSLESTFCFGVIPGEKPTVESSAFTSTRSVQETFSPSPKGLLKSATYGLSMNKDRLLSWKVICSGLDEDGDPEFHFLIEETYFDTIKHLQKIVVDRETDEDYIRVRAVLRGLLPQYLIAQLVQEEEEESDAEQQEQWLIEPVPEIVYNVSRQLSQTLTEIDYMGPLRSPAKRYYLTSLGISPPMDPAGEFLPFVLREIDRYEVSYMSPGLGTEAERGPLAQALNLWIHYIRTGEESPREVPKEEIDLETTKVLVEFRIRSIVGNELHPLADSGFGYSQLLPIIVRGLLADVGHTLIVEQPELHLNPAVQVRVAEFLVAMARAGKQVLVETHSEHIVNTIRVLAAEDESGKLASIAGIFYIDVSLEKPVVHELSIQQDGTVPDWPRQFFGEAASLTGRLLKAQKRLRKQATRE
jgi:energy-coupling factor transporter ATP-binding protein EcfA2